MASVRSILRHPRYKFTDRVISQNTRLLDQIFREFALQIFPSNQMWSTQHCTNSWAETHYSRIIKHTLDCRSQRCWLPGFIDSCHVVQWRNHNLYPPCSSFRCWRIRHFLFACQYHGCVFGARRTTPANWSGNQTKSLQGSLPYDSGEAFPS